MESMSAGGRLPPPNVCDTANPADTTASPNDAWNEKFIVVGQILLIIIKTWRIQQDRLTVLTVI